MAGASAGGASPGSAGAHVPTRGTWQVGGLTNSGQTGSFTFDVEQPVRLKNVTITFPPGVAGNVKVTPQWVYRGEPNPLIRYGSGKKYVNGQGEIALPMDEYVPAGAVLTMAFDATLTRWQHDINILVEWVAA